MFGLKDVNTSEQKHLELTYMQKYDKTSDTDKMYFYLGFLGFRLVFTLKNLR